MICSNMDRPIIAIRQVIMLKNNVKSIKPPIFVDELIFFRSFFYFVKVVAIATWT